jgi:acyl-coenzyme A synthetase/AMP-(fatty) acid ligase/acyl carrier protein
VYVIYTSGSTGKPKGVMNAHQGITNRLYWMQDAFDLNGTDRVLQKTPFSFDVSVWEFFWPLFTGAQLVIAKPDGHRDPQYLVELIDKTKVTTIHFVPSMLQLFLDVRNLADKCSSLQRVICSGEALSFNLQKKFFSILNVGLHNLYGPTEAAVDVTWWPCSSKTEVQVVPIGKPISNIKLYILDSHFNLTPMGIPGELHIGGVGVARGYLNKPDLTTERFVSDPFEKNKESRLYKTGDKTRWLADGSVEYLGRLDYQVKIRGNRIELGEIEATLASHPSVKDVVVAVESERNEKSIIAYIVASNDADTGLQDFLQTYLTTKLPEYMLPSHFFIIEAIPLTPNGKADRKALLTMSRSSFAYKSSKPYIAPRTRTEKQLAEIWREILHVEKISVDDNFFDLGGNSLLLIQALFLVQKSFNVTLTISNMFETTNLGDLARRIEKLPKKFNAPIERSERILKDIDFPDSNSPTE